MKDSAGALLDPGKAPSIAYGRDAAAARTLASARAAPRIMDDGAQTRLPRRFAPNKKQLVPWRADLHADDRLARPSGGFGERLELHLEAEPGELGDQTPGFGSGRAAIEVVGAKIVMRSAVFSMW